MKKTLLVLGVLAILSTSVYSYRGYGYGGGCIGQNYGGMGRGSGYHMGAQNSRYHNLSPEQQQEYLAIYNKYSIEIQQKRLDIEKELLNEKPNWKKIEKLNEEMAKLEAQMRTEHMKNTYN